MELQQIKQRFGIIGTYSGLDRAIDIARQVAPTDLSVLISGESGTGKENFPKIRVLAANLYSLISGRISTEKKMPR